MWGATRQLLRSLPSLPARQIHTRPYIPRRAMLYVPGNDQRKISKLSALPHLDCAILDCEDGVALNKKEEARANICRTLDEHEFGRTECSVRVNSVVSGLINDDLAAILKASRVPETILVPKVESPEQVDYVVNQIKTHMGGRKLPFKLRLILYVESALSLLNLRDICSRATALSGSDGTFILEGLVFGSDDFCADIGATRTARAKEVSMARQAVVVVAKAFKIHAIDVVYIDYKDLEGLKRQALEGYHLGFTGKQVIHPSHVDLVQESFTPSAERITWARDLIRLFQEHQKSGKGAFTFQGAMIDRPLLLQAQNIVELAKVSS